MEESGVLNITGCSFPRCLTPQADLRPDIVAVSSKISDILMKFMDGLYISQHTLERRADRDRRRAQKYFLESHRGSMSMSQVSFNNNIPIDTCKDSGKKSDTIFFVFLLLQIVQFNRCERTIQESKTTQSILTCRSNNSQHDLTQGASLCSNSKLERSKEVTF